MGILIPAVALLILRFNDVLSSPAGEDEHQHALRRSESSFQHRKVSADLFLQTGGTSKKTSWRGNDLGAYWQGLVTSLLDAGEALGVNVYSQLRQASVLGNPTGGAAPLLMVYSPQSDSYDCNAEEFGFEGQHTELVCDIHGKLEEFFSSAVSGFSVSANTNKLRPRAIKGDILENENLALPAIAASQTPPLNLTSQDDLAVAQGIYGQLTSAIGLIVPGAYSNELFTLCNCIYTNSTVLSGRPMSEVYGPVQYDTLTWGDGYFKYLEQKTFKFKNSVRHKHANLFISHFVKQLNTTFLVEEACSENYQNENSEQDCWIKSHLEDVLVGYFFNHKLGMKMKTCDLFELGYERNERRLCSYIYGAKKAKKDKKEIKLDELLNSYVADHRMIFTVNKKVCPAPNCFFLKCAKRN